jgi:hypothetical protein
MPLVLTCVNLRFTRCTPTGFYAHRLPPTCMSIGYELGSFCRARSEVFGRPREAWSHPSWLLAASSGLAASCFAESIHKMIKSESIVRAVVPEPAIGGPPGLKHPPRTSLRWMEASKRLAISLILSLSTRCQRRILPIVSTQITPGLLRKLRSLSGCSLLRDHTASKQ